MTTNTQPAAQPKRRWYQFSLRTLLIGTAVVAVGLAVLDWRWIGPARRQRAAVKAVEGFRGIVIYADAPSDELWFVRKLRDWLPRDYFDDVVRIDLLTRQEMELICLEEFPALERLNVQGPGVTDASLVHLKGRFSNCWKYFTCEKRK